MYNCYINLVTQCKHSDADGGLSFVTQLLLDGCGVPIKLRYQMFIDACNGP